MTLLATALKIGLVFGLLALALRYLRRYDTGALLKARRGGRPVELLGQTRLSKTTSIAVVRIGTQSYAVGVNEKSVALLLPHAVELPELGNDAELRDSSSPLDADGCGQRAPLDGVLALLPGQRRPPVDGPARVAGQRQPFGVALREAAVAQWAGLRGQPVPRGSAAHAAVEHSSATEQSFARTLLDVAPEHPTDVLTDGSLSSSTARTRST